MKRLLFFLLLLFNTSVFAADPIVIDHTCTDLSQIPDSWIEAAKELTFHYATRSHGTQILEGLEVLENLDSKYSYAVREATTEGLPDAEDPIALLIYSGNPSETYINKNDYWNDDTEDGGASDALTRTEAVAATEHYDFSMWAWSFDYDYSSATTENQGNLYLTNLAYLETTYTPMRFIYMTGPATVPTGTGPTLLNPLIRNYVDTNDKILLDIFDLEQYDPDGNYYSDADDNCKWCDDWCDTHVSECANVPDTCQHSEDTTDSKYLCVYKAKAFWWMMARLAGWDGVSGDGKVTVGNGVPVSIGSGTAWNIAVGE